MTSQGSWIYWAVLSATFAALTAIFAKIGIQGIDSDFATLVRTAVIIVVLALFVWFAGKWSDPFALPTKTWVFLTLSGLATGASWVCYFRALQIGEASKVAPVDKLSLVLVAVFAFAFLARRHLPRRGQRLAGAPERRRRCRSGLPRRRFRQRRMGRSAASGGHCKGDSARDVGSRGRNTCHCRRRHASLLAGDGQRSSETAAGLCRGRGADHERCGGPRAQFAVSASHPSAAIQRPVDGRLLSDRRA
jgi:bacterial/archaeal transporter family protein